MNEVFKKVPSWVWLLGAAGVVLWVSKKGVSGVVADVTSGAINGVGDVVGGVVVGAGSVVGIPSTNKQKCINAIYATNDFEATKFCTLAQLSKWQYLSMVKKVTGRNFSINDVFE